MPETETVYVRGEGGSVIAMDLPLPEAIADRLTKGQLRRVNADGSLYAPADDDPAAPALPDRAPAQAAPKAEWIGWAVANGADPDAVEGLTKADLIDQYGDRPE